MTPEQKAKLAADLEDVAIALAKAVQITMPGISVDRRGKEMILTDLAGVRWTVTVSRRRGSNS